MKPKLRKIGSIVTATVVACALFLTGTFAWQSISQEALNEKAGASNPGGRLHDDFDGTNKDVYVENFTDTETGVPIFARIRLQEYMEMGADAGKKKEDPSRKVTVIGKEGADINKPSTWNVHKQEYVASGSTGTTNPETIFHDYWTLEFGGSTVYMPTFNKNKDSLESDQNGTIGGLDGKYGTADDHDKPYSDYKTYEVGQKETQDAIYDADDNDTDEKTAAEVDVNIKKVPEEHEAKATEEGTVITMAEWKAQGAKAGKYWVYDTDGWAYWASPIEPQTATGLLLSGIQMQRQPDEDWYYAINVVGQFATSGDWGKQEDSSGFYKDGITKDGLLVLNTAAKRLPTIAHMQPKKGYKQYARAGEKLTLEVDLDIKNPTGSLTESHVIWTSEPPTSALSGNTFTANSSMVGQTYKLTATSNIDSTKKTTVEVYVYPSEASGVVIGELDGKSYIDFGDNTFKEIKEGETLGNFICGGADEKIGTNDDRTDVVVLEHPDANYGTKFLGPNIGDSYWAMGPDDKLGTSDDIKVVGSPEWPQNITNRLADSIKITTNGDTKEAKVGKRLQLNASVTLKGQPIAVQDVTWTVSGNKQTGTKINEKGVLTVDPNETAGDTLTVYAESKEMKDLKTNIKLTIVPLDYSDIPDVTAGSTTTVTIDGIEWYVLVKDGGKALLLAKNAIDGNKSVVSGSNAWNTSTLRTYLNGTFLTGKTTLNEHLATTDLQTWNGTTWASSQDKVFLLTEADVVGTKGGTGKATSEAKDYTYGNAPIVPEAMRKLVSTYWTRSTYSQTLAYIRSDGTGAGGSPNSSDTNVIRPALWVNLS